MVAPQDYNGLQAKSLFTMLKEKAGPNYDVEFTASSGWFRGGSAYCSA